MHVLIFKKKTLIKTAICAALVLFCVICTGVFYGDTKTTFGEKTYENMPVCSIDTNEKVVALTIDTAFGEDHTKEILRALKNNGIKATFFVMGEWGAENPNLVEEIIAEGHEIASHSMTHIRYTDVSKEEMLDDARQAKEYIDAMGGKGNIIRLPYGAYNDEVVNALFTKGYIPVMWSNDGEDWKESDSNAVCTKVVSKVTGGDIIMLQNNTQSGADAINCIVSGLKEKNYEFATISEIMPEGDIITDKNGRASTFKE